MPCVGFVGTSDDWDPRPMAFGCCGGTEPSQGVCCWRSVVEGYSTDRQWCLMVSFVLVSCITVVGSLYGFTANAVLGDDMDYLYGLVATAATGIQASSTTAGTDLRTWNQQLQTTNSNAGLDSVNLNAAISAATAALYALHSSLQHLRKPSPVTLQFDYLLALISEL